MFWLQNAHLRESRCRIAMLYKTKRLMNTWWVQCRNTIKISDAMFDMNNKFDK